jgi:hypothetical protein
VDEVVADARPFLAHRLAADVVRHARGARREDGEVAAALLLQPELRLHALDEYLVADPQVARQRPARRVGQAGELLVAELLQRRRLGRVVTVNVDDHEPRVARQWPALRPLTVPFIALPFTRPS